MFLGEHAITEPPVCTEDMSLAEVYELLSASGDRLVVVLDSEAHRVPIGVVTERSICAQIVGRMRDPRGLAAAHVIDSKISKVRRGDLLDSAEDRSQQVPVIVVDRDQRFVGVYKGPRPERQIAPPVAPGPHVRVRGYAAA